MKKRVPRRFAVCIRNRGNEASLERNKIYVVIPDRQAEAEGLVRVIDEDAEDYLYPADWFVAVELPPKARSTASSKPQSRSSQSSGRRQHKGGSRKGVPPARRVAFARVKDDLSRYLKLAADGEIVITHHGRPAGILIGFATEEDWFDYRLEHDPEFLSRIQEARRAIQAGQGVPIGNVPR